MLLYIQCLDSTNVLNNAQVKLLLRWIIYLQNIHIVSVYKDKMLMTIRSLTTVSDKQLQNTSLNATLVRNIQKDNNFLFKFPFND